MITLTWMFILGGVLIAAACVESLWGARWDRRDQARFEAERPALEAWLATFHQPAHRRRQRPLQPQRRRANA